MTRRAGSEIVSSVRARRERAGLSQTALAARAGASRQTLNAVETGKTVPGTLLALRLAAVLGCRVEDLFGISTARAELVLRARLIDPPVIADARGGRRAPGGRNRPEGAAAGQRVSLARVGSRLVAVPLVGELAAITALPGADGLVRRSYGATADVRPLSGAEHLPETVVVAGCDPALPVVAWHLQRVRPRHRIAWLPAGSTRALGWLRSGAAHVAGLHLRDVKSGEDNVPLVRRALAGRRVAVLGFATWEQGLIVARGNPRGVRTVVDLVRRDIVIVNREPGSGARGLLDSELRALGLPAARVRGYGREAPSHLAAAQAVALGFADVAIGVRSAARAFGLAFVPLRHERYDLVVPRAFLDEPPVQAFLEAARTAAVRADLAALGDYDTSRLGDTLAVLP